MKRKRFTEEQIIAALKEVEAGLAVQEVTRKHGISGVLPASVREIELPVGVPSSGAARAAGGRSWQDERGQFRPR